MRLRLTSWILLLAVGFCQAQTINRAEYFFDSDPGPGNGIPLTIAAGDPVTFTTTINTTGLGPGYHRLFIRTRTSTAKWSLYEPQEFVIDGGIIAAEYFFDVDPGIGGGTNIPITPVTSTIKPTIPTSSLPDGEHYLYVRTRHDGGHWSLHTPQRFIIRTRIVAAEYFVDSDPGFGNGAPLTVSTPSDLVNINTSIVTDPLPNGVHYLFVRTKDIHGKWSLFEPQPFTVDSALPIELLQFSAALTPQRSVHLKWTTLSEINNDFFSVQHSLDGFEFTELQRLPGAGNSLETRQYQAVHRSPMAGLNYYRLKQTDTDGKASLSRIVAINVPDQAGVLVYPNPTAGDWFVDFRQVASEDRRKIELVDQVGRILIEKVQAGNELIRFSREGLSNGTYLLQITTDKGTRSVQKIVMR